MRCERCKFGPIPEGAKFCPNCGVQLPQSPIPSTQITVTQEVGTLKGGQVTGVEIGKVKGKVTILSTLKQIEKKIVQGDYVDRQTITNNILVLGPQALDEIAKRIAGIQGVDKQTFKNLGAQSVPENVNRQIAELVAAQKEVETRGVPLTPQAAYQLGMLAAYNREYETALAYLSLATQSDPEFSDAFEAMAWLRQSRAMDDLNARNYTAAMEKLSDARSAALHTDPLDPSALTQRGYIAKTMAQVAEAMNDQLSRQKHYEEAAKLFQHVIQLEPNNAGAHNGLGNIEYALGNMNAAVAAYHRAIELLPNYTAAHHDLALAFEGKMQGDQMHKDDWRQKAIQEWQRTYDLAPNDPGFSAEYTLKIGQRITWLKQQCSKTK